MSCRTRFCAVKSRRRFRDVDNPIAYMFQIARNEAARAAKRNRNVDQALPAHDLFIAPVSPYPTHDDVEAAANALARLPAEDRELVELKIFAALTFREIADVMQLPQGTVATRYRRALESLRSWLTKQFR